MKIVQMNWNNILENALGNGISDLIIGAFVVVVVTRFFEKLSHRRDSIGALILIDAEIQVNKHILEDMLNEMIPSLEKQMRRGKQNEIPLDQPTFDDAARFMKIPADKLLFGAFQSSYSGLGNLENISLLEKILNLYTVSYHYRIQTSFEMEQIAYVLKEPIEGIISGGILRLQTKSDVESEYLSLCINSIIGQWQAERDAGGSVIAHWKPEQIKNLVIPVLPKSTQQKIADLVRKSHEARKRSRELLEQAKREVEHMIEKEKNE